MPLKKRLRRSREKIVRYLTKKHKFKIVKDWLEQDIPLLEEELKDKFKQGLFYDAAEVSTQLRLMRFIRDELLTGNTNQLPNGDYSI